jgi:uncharacterized membrane protein
MGAFLREPGTYSKTGLAIQRANVTIPVVGLAALNLVFIMRVFEHGLLSIWGILLGAGLVVMAGGIVGLAYIIRRQHRIMETTKPR